MNCPEQSHYKLAGETASEEGDFVIVGNQRECSQQVLPFMQYHKLHHPPIHQALSTIDLTDCGR